MTTPTPHHHGANPTTAPVEAGPTLEVEHHHAPATGRELTRTAVSATLHCLTGCAIGEIAGMVLGTALNWSNLTTTVAAIVLAFVFGYALTFTSLRRAGVPVRDAVRATLAADTVSIAVMELVDTAFLFAVPGAMDAGLADPMFWWSLALALAVAFVVTVPVNRWMIARGRGHAAVHAYH